MREREVVLGVDVESAVTELPEDMDKFRRITTDPSYPKNDPWLFVAEREFATAYLDAIGLWNLAKQFVGNRDATMRYVAARLAYGRWRDEFNRVRFRREKQT